MSVVTANTIHAWLEGQFIDIHIFWEEKGHPNEWSEEWRENGEKKAFWPDIDFRWVFKLQQFSEELNKLISDAFRGL